MMCYVLLLDNQEVVSNGFGVDNLLSFFYIEDEEVYRTPQLISESRVCLQLYLMYWT